jgi:hypothetical protein
MALGAANDGTRSPSPGARVLFAVLLAGCVAQQAPAPPGQTARLPDEGFFFDQEGSDARLAYGRANSDDVQLMLRCEAGQGQVEITDAVLGEAKTGDLLLLISGKAKSALPARVETNEESGGRLAIVQADTSASALDGFRRSGVIAVRLGTRQYELSATASEKAAIARFFSLCDRR